MLTFPTQLAAIHKRLQAIDPERYAASRNYKHGALTYLSPYLSRGVLSTQRVYRYIRTMGLAWSKIEKLVQELAWRDYWQHVWRHKLAGIMTDLCNQQQPVRSHQLPTAIVKASTGIKAIDDAIAQFYTTGYMHNHMRMYVASICCNLAHVHWLAPARWMYSHLLDGDLASNHLSWQWVAGTFSKRKYYANQQNINFYFGGGQRDTFLDYDYSQLPKLKVPDVLLETMDSLCTTSLPTSRPLLLNRDKETLVYNYYNLDPYWYTQCDVQRILLLEPSFFSAYPVHKHCVDFIMALASNINKIQIFVGEFAELQQWVRIDKLLYKEHPTTRHYVGKEESRDWLVPIKGHYASFFAYWKQYKRILLAQ